MGKIYYIMGKSSSGKDSIYKKIINNNDLRFKTIVSYTTRPIRDGETDGIEYYFTDKNKFIELKNQNKIIEYREYNTVHGIWYYYIVDDVQINIMKNNYILIGTPEGFEHLTKYYGSEKIVPIYIEVEDGERLQRALDREKMHSNPDYKEMCRRFLTDAKDFSEENLRRLSINRKFLNNDIENTYIQIMDYIKGFVHDE